MIALVSAITLDPVLLGPPGPHLFGEETLSLLKAVGLEEEKERKTAPFRAYAMFLRPPDRHTWVPGGDFAFVVLQASGKDVESSMLKQRDDSSRRKAEHDRGCARNPIGI